MLNQSCVLKACVDDARLLPQALAGAAEGGAGLREVGAADVAQLDVLEVLPDAFLGIGLRRVPGEALEADAGGGAIAQELLDERTPVDRRPVPDDEQFAGEVTQQVAQEADDLHARDRALVPPEVELRVEPHRADDREVVVGEPVAQDRRLADRRVRSRDRREQVEAALIDEQQRAPVRQRPLF
jgi:hypothetical protein